MLTAHLPAGYLLAGKLKGPRTPVLWAALLGSIFPDFDLAFFFLVDHHSIHHHRYWVHIPLFWLLIGAVAFPALRKSTHLPALSAFFAAIFLHLILDTLVGGIMWGAPFSDRLYNWVTIAHGQGQWVKAFIFHWTFLLEIAVWCAAAALYWSRRTA